MENIGNIQVSGSKFCPMVEKAYHLSNYKIYIFKQFDISGAAKLKLHDVEEDSAHKTKSTVFTTSHESI